MAAEQEIRNMSEDNIFDALMEQHGKAGNPSPATLKTVDQGSGKIKHWLDVEWHSGTGLTIDKKLSSSNAAETFMISGRIYRLS